MIKPPTYREYVHLWMNCVMRIHDDLSSCCGCVLFSFSSISCSLIDFWCVILVDQSFFHFSSIHHFPSPSNELWWWDQFLQIAECIVMFDHFTNFPCTELKWMICICALFAFIGRCVIVLTSRVEITQKHTQYYPFYPFICSFIFRWLSIWFHLYIYETKITSHSKFRIYIDF